MWISWAESQTAHSPLDHRKHIKEQGRESEGIYGDILVLMSAPPVGSFSLTFMLNFFSLSGSLIVSPSLSFFSCCSSLHFLLIIQSATALLFINLTRLLLLPLHLSLSDAHIYGGIYKYAHFSHSHKQRTTTPTASGGEKHHQVPLIGLLSPSQKPEHQANQAGAAAAS